ncbi:ent-kaurene oxidase [Verticillium alfalfae VaMs.102]|uniref:Ent-kaurene oxidase n=1 Tax=Verticillium alfalfae (strain VaMs.102 / ATCC MYA-4576 / FGSC 10136) TaxID=526221 RepID=C9SBQ2_VERA1|nr:ent-kaurene oxidase [Verticillium alfalfae VaMs.102]EEY15786.1 ent-kaurene oxidase [Verticillium alfalfae VaMs.102]
MLQHLKLVITDLNLYQAVALAGILAFAISWSLWETESYYPGFEVYGVEKESVSLYDAKQKFMTDARRILFDGAAKINGVFQIVSANGPRLILPSNYADELKGHKNLSARRLIATDLFSHIPGFEAARALMHSDIIVDTIRKNLTNSLGPIATILHKETATGIDQMYFTTEHSDGWRKYDEKQHSIGLVGMLSTRIFLGPEMVKNKRWLAITTDYTIVLMIAARALRMWTPVLRPIVHWFLPECTALRRVSRDARNIIDDEVSRIEAHVGQSDALSPSKSSIGNSLGWMRAAAKGTNFNLGDGQLFLSFASLHTTSDLLTKTLVNLCTFPEFQDLLRNEILDTLRGQSFDPTCISQMRLLDSFMKETQRLAPASLSLMNRLVEKKITLHDGTVLPNGALISVIPSRLYDDEIYPQATKFDGYRFLELRARPGEETHHQLVRTNIHQAGFGYGNHSCPGRFFASLEIKIILIHLLLRFDWRREGSDNSPTTIFSGAETMSNPEITVYYKERLTELDLKSILDLTPAPPDT